ncbi:MAG: sigma 54-interacting transcriptional regulator [Pseudomonadota bacterium]
MYQDRDRGNNEDATLPTVALRRRRRYLARRLIVTIAFHPDLSRVGESTAISMEACRAGIEVGRGMPLFSRHPSGEEQMGVPLADAYISRRALFLQVREGTLLVERPADASLVNVSGQALDSGMTFPAQRLTTGVPVVLSNRIVLLVQEQDFELPPAHEPQHLGLLVGSSLYMRHLRSQIESLQRSGVDVLLTGETGTGKGEVARALHMGSDGPFIALNMSTLTAGLAAATLFGAERGAYTGADHKRVGYFQQASGGTLFMDEVGDTAADVQPQLLRALEEREVQVVGGAVVRVELRVIAASDIDLENSDSFRSALRFRLARHTLSLRPLREHKEDIGELCLAFIEELSEPLFVGLQQLDPIAHAMWADLMGAFLRYDWPGNIRELRNAISEVVHQSDGKLPRVPPSILDAVNARNRTSEQIRERTADDFDDAQLKSELERQDWEVTAAARVLGISRSALNRRVARMPDVRQAMDIPASEIREVLDDCADDLTSAAKRLRISRAALAQRLRTIDMEDGD